MTSQREMVRASLLAPVAAETHHDVYSVRRPRVAARPPIVPETVARQVCELGALLVAAEGAERRSWLVLRLRNRLDLLEALDGRGGRL